ncbi:DUF6644 family protein [Adhaeribacter rhizoryzae]|uniref:DUF6644 domain-containing protein n=1 Tax=Adhaeribacter rhizoryzae TaxID=2607907 RepID=A0A5M6DAB5_9BACT|nr:DUF6644 family protein [Adhaeribacter rhizoryzae]KAA5543466.1 hypothetical protein F0145_16235 [Adhaeribacter rhizoryzae]
MAALVTEVFRWLEDSVWAVTIRQSVWLYPALEVVHILGIVIIVGAAFMFDLRLLGFGREISVQHLAGHLLSWSRRGLWLVVPSGFLLFITDALALGYSFTFWLKMALLSLAGFNALIFHQFTFASAAGWATYQVAPIKAKAAAIISILLWLGVIICGRWLAY